MPDNVCVLAVEQSTPCGSIAILRGDALVAARTWTDNQRRNQVLFRELAALCRSTEVRLDEVELFAVGTGPGSFSGLRMAVASVRAMALPGDRPVIGIGSGEALAWTIGHETRREQIAVVGDARRECLWVGVFRLTSAGVETIRPYCLCGPNDLRAIVPVGAVVVTSEWPRIGHLIGRAIGRDRDVLPETRYPEARAVARLAMSANRLNAPNAVSPIYLHPPALRKP